VIENKPTGCEKSLGSELTFRREVEHVTMKNPIGATCTAEDLRSLGAGRLDSPAAARSLGAGR
jgi:hypothetical protein